MLQTHVMQYNVKWSQYFWKMYPEKHRGCGIKDPQIWMMTCWISPDHSESLWMDIRGKHLACAQSPASGKIWLFTTLFLNTWEFMI